MGIPTVVITLADSNIGIGESSLVTFTFSEAIDGPNFRFGAYMDFPSGSIGGFSTSDNVVWTTTFTPDAATMDATNVVTLAMFDIYDVGLNFNGSGFATSATYAVDTVRPTASVVVDDDTLLAGDTSAVTFTFSEVVTDFTNADLTIAHGTLSAVTDSGDGITWTATLTPEASVTDATNLISLNMTTIADVAGNAGLGSQDSNGYAIATVRPTATIVVADDALAIGETSTVTFTFSEAVSGLDAGDLTIANGTIGAITTADGGVVWTGTLTPTAAISDISNLITLNNAAVGNAAGNVGAGVTYSNNYEIDTARPTATIMVAEAGLLAGDTSLVTFTFSEAVAGFTLDDVTTESGSLANLTTGDNITWTATLTPTAAVNDATNVVTLDNTAIADVAGNAGLSTTTSNSYEVTTVRPSATIVVADATLTVGETSPVTITFSEAVTGFANNDLTIANGTLSAVTSGDGGVTWTATLTPTAAVVDTSNMISLAKFGIMNAAGNAGIGVTNSNSYAIDTTPLPAPPPPPQPAPAPVEMPGTATADVIVGNALSNVIVAGDADDVVSGGAGDDTVSGDAGDDRLQGNIGADDVAGGAGADVVLGGQDDDHVQGNTGADYVSGDKGDDTVLGGQDQDIVYGGEGADYASGDKGDDIVRGGQGDDRVLGGDGNDFVSGDRGNDTVSGGLGADLFHSFGDAGVDLVTDFNAAEGDRVMLLAGASYTVEQVGADTVIQMAGGAEMTLANVQLASLPSDWIFAA